MLTEKIDIVKKRYDEIYKLIGNPEIIADQKKYIELYTKEIIVYWKTILSKTKIGRQTPNLFAFKNFVNSSPKTAPSFTVQPH